MADYQVINGIRVRQEGIGERFGRGLQVGPRMKIGQKWFAVTACDCGKMFVRRYPAYTSSCGCEKDEAFRERNVTHGMTGMPTHQSWRGMIGRCTQPSNAMYHRYGGRGIKVCARWKRFENFLSDMGERPDGCTLDRIDTNGHYEPGNCRWATVQEQARNTTRVIYMTYKGETKMLIDFAKEFGIKYGTLRRRKADGWSDEKCLTYDFATERYRKKPLETDT